MKRRTFAQALGAGAALAGSLGMARAEKPMPAQDGPRAQPRGPAIGMLVYPDMVLLDLVGPQTVFSLLMGSIHLVGKTMAPVATDVGVPIAPNCTFADCPAELDVLFVPGGLKGSVALMDDAETMAFVADRGARARFVTAVCTGSLVLGAAGLLTGYAATSHWYVRDLLPLMGATRRDARVVTDRNRITGGGVTAGLDFGLTLAAMLRGEDHAKLIQLVLEYDPKPPFSAGSPEGAGTALTGDVLARRKPAINAARAAAQRAQKRLGT